MESVSALPAPVNYSAYTPGHSAWGAYAFYGLSGSTGGGGRRLRE